ncbi:DUF2628 domain-containing protein [Candidatus Pacearchaeota archaeon]|nr:DUF2628 domain-containing protein [Candidatus Pacearchaeota archaeon]
MQTYTIYQNPDGRIEAVKGSWSWPAFLFGFVWALCKKLYLQAVLAPALLYFFALTYGFVRGLSGGNVDIYQLQSLFAILSLLGAFIFGAFGNEWRQMNLLKRGYEAISTQDGYTAEGAVAAYRKSTNVATELEGYDRRE